MLSSWKIKGGGGRRERERKELGPGNWKEWSIDMWLRVGVSACVR